MDAFEEDEVPMLSTTYLQVGENENPQSRRFTSRMRSASISIPMDSMDSYESEKNFAGHTGPLRNERRTPFIQMSGPIYAKSKNENLFQPTQGAIGSRTAETTVEEYPTINEVDQNDWPNRNYERKNEHLLKSGQLGMCNDPYCTTCPTYFKGQQKNTKSSGIFDQKFHNVLYGDAKGWARRTFSSLHPYIPGVMNPHAKIVQQWNKFFVISCLVAVFLDPLFFFLLSVEQDSKCIVINWTMTTALVVFRSINDFIYLMHMLLQEKYKNTMIEKYGSEEEANKIAFDPDLWKDSAGGVKKGRLFGCSHEELKVILGESSTSTDANSRSVPSVDLKASIRAAIMTPDMRQEFMKMF